MEIPTLLIGLGGIGSSVVEKVHQRIPAHQRERLVVHAFDTNVNDIRKRRSLKGKITQTSANWSIGEYLLHSDASVSDWFPAENKELRNKLLTDGAGEVRSASRLAYRAAMEQGKLKRFQEQISKLFTTTAEKTTANPRVMIISSLSGGTGAGIFLQVAMYLQNYLAENFGKKILVIRGAFLMPDALILTSLLDRAHWEAARANGYACLKELNAIYEIKFDQMRGQHMVPMELEFEPGQKNITIQQSDPISGGQPPYHMVFLYDFENVRGENLGSFENYLDQMADTVFIQLFSPLSDNNYSEEDNQLRSLIKGQSMNRFCGAGAACLVYPYEDIIKYCAHRWAEKSLSDEWLRLDREFEDAFTRYKRDLYEKNVVGSKPEIGSYYIETMNQLSRGDSPDPFYRQIYLSTRLLDDRGKEVGTKAQAFMDAVKLRIDKVLAEDDDLQLTQNTCKTLDEGRLKSRDDAKHTIISHEIALEDYKETVVKQIHAHKVFIINQVIGQDCDAPAGLGQNQDYCLNAWILKRSAPLHPVGVRYLLYEIKQLLAEELGRLKKKNKDLEEHIQGYAGAYDDVETPEEETIEDRIRVALNQAVFKRIFDNRFKELIEEYLDKSARQFSNINAYQTSKLAELVYEDLDRGLDVLIDIFESFFQNLRPFTIKLRETGNQLENLHEDLPERPRRYVLATAEDKQRLWGEIEMTAHKDNVPDEICRHMYVALYQEFCGRHYPLRRKTLTGGDIKQLFETEVLGSFEKKLRTIPRLKMNAIEALKEQARYHNVNPDKLIREKLEALDVLALPLIRPNRVNEDNTIRYWGIHPACIENYQRAQLKDLFAEDDARIINDEAFAPTEIIRYRAYFGYLAEEFPKLLPPDPASGLGAGVYYEEYARQLELMESGGINRKGITPHLDKRWHKPAFLPPIGRVLQRVENQRVIAAFLLGTIHAVLTVGNYDGREIWEYIIDSQLKTLKAGDRPVPGGFYDLYKALYQNPSAINAVNHMVAAVQSAERKGNPLQGVGQCFIDGCKKVAGLDINIFQAIFGMLAEAPAEDLTTISLNLLEGVLEEILNHHLHMYGPAKQNTARKEAAAFVNQLLPESSAYVGAGEENSPAYRQWKTKIESFIAQQAG